MPEKTKKPLYRRLWFQVVAGLFVIGLVGNAVNPNSDTSPTSAGVTSSSAYESRAAENKTEGASDEADNEPSDSTVREPSENEEGIQTDSTEDLSSKRVEPERVAAPTTSTSLMALLATLGVAPEITEGYDRDLFKHWSDADGDGCNSRYEVLIEESITPVTISSGCKLSGGTWASAFDLKETEDPSTFDVDHLVPLKEAWDSGAWAWDASTREAFANDLGYNMSLIAVSASSNRSKSDRDPAEWMPPNTDYWCEYITAWVQVKARWSLTVDSTEKSRITEIADDCGGQALNFAPRADTETSTPSPSATSTPSPSASPTPTATTTPSAEPSPTQTASGECGPGQVDLNTASLDELRLIKYIDIERAPLVVNLRPFESVDQLINVKGIGPTYLQRIKDEGIACVN